jgi:hypothetical protein
LRHLNGARENGDVTKTAVLSFIKGDFSSIHSTVQPLAMPQVIRDGCRVTKKYANSNSNPQKNRRRRALERQVQENSTQHMLEYVRSTLIHAVNELESRYGGNSIALALLWRVRFALTEVDRYEDEDEDMGEYEDEYEDGDEDDEEGGVLIQ